MLKTLDVVVVVCVDRWVLMGVNGMKWNRHVCCNDLYEIGKCVIGNVDVMCI
jgi:hypothetical protein